MTQPNIDPTIQALQYIQAGRLAEARALLANVVRQNPKSEQAWVLLSRTLTDPKQKTECLERVLRLNPNNAEALAALTALKPSAPPPNTPSPSVPPPLAKVSPFTTNDLGPELDKPPAPPVARPVATPPPVAPPPAKRTPPSQPEPEPESIFAQEWDPNLAPEDSLRPSESEPVTPAKPVRPTTRNTRANQVRANRAKPASAPATPDRAIPANPQLAQQILTYGAVGILALVGLFIIVGGVILYNNNVQKDRATQAAVTALAAVSYASAVYPTLPPTFTITPTPTITNTPLPTSTPTRTPVPTPKLPPPTVAAQMDTIQQQVADLRGLSATTDLQRYVIDRNKVDATLEEMFSDGGGSKGEVDDEARVLVALRLVNPTFDLYTYTLSGISDGLGGFYAPWNKRLYVIGTKFSGVERFIYSHEYDHALTDAHFNIAGLGVYPNCTRTEQQCEAIRGLVEGDATLLMNQWFEQYASPQDVKDILNQNYQPSNRQLPGQFPPPYASREAAWPYAEGLDFVQFLYQHGNWNAVNQAYQNLPTTTEQVLHPQKYLDGESALPVDPVPLDGVLTPDWRLLKSDSLGEWMTYLLLSYSADNAAQLNLGTGERAAAGWGGDHYQVYYNDAAAQEILVAHWAWDTPNDAQEFKNAMLTYQDKRFRGNKVDLGHGDCWEANGQTSCMFWRDNDSLWIMAPTHDLVNTILARAGF